MALTKETVIDSIEVREDGSLHVRHATYILEDGERIAGPIYRRATFVRGADVAALPRRVRDIAALVWGPRG